MASPRVKQVGNKWYFVCDYTGALIENRFFWPAKKRPTKRGCFCSLPVLLRANVGNSNFDQIKSDCEDYFNQPDIPIQPELKEKENRELTEIELENYLDQLDMGLSWLNVYGAQNIDKFIKEGPPQECHLENGKKELKDPLDPISSMITNTLRTNISMEIKLNHQMFLNRQSQYSNRLE